MSGPTDKQLEVLISPEYGKVVADRNKIVKQFTEQWDKVVNVIEMCRYTPEGKTCLAHNQPGPCPVNMMEVLLDHFDDDGNPMFEAK
jgi:hypothetical protein